MEKGTKKMTSEGLAALLQSMEGEFIIRVEPGGEGADGEDREDGEGGTVPA